MRFEELFEKRSLVAEKLKECLRENGFTKVSFSKKAEISRPTLDKLLNGEIDSKVTFDKHMSKVLSVLNMSANELLLFNVGLGNRQIEAVYSENAPADYAMNERATKQYDLLQDVLDLCRIYY